MAELTHSLMWNPNHGGDLVFLTYSFYFVRDDEQGRDTKNLCWILLVSNLRPSAWKLSALPQDHKAPFH
jgi:hypothetical protein